MISPVKNILNRKERKGREGKEEKKVKRGNYSFGFWARKKGHLDPFLFCFYLKNP
jgi:hypothetical protein